MEYYVFSFILLVFGLSGLGYSSSHDNIPEAPSLSALDVKKLPVYLRNLVKAEVPPKNHSPIKGKTTGFNLNNGKGYVWNDISAPKLIYHIGEEEPDHKEVKITIPKYEDQNTTDSNNISSTTEHNIDHNADKNDIEVIFKPNKNPHPKAINKHLHEPKKGKEKTDKSTQSSKNINNSKTIEVNNTMKNLEEIYNTTKKESAASTIEESILLTPIVNDDVTTEYPITTTENPNGNAKLININELKQIFSDIIKILSSKETKEQVSRDNVIIANSNKAIVKDKAVKENKTSIANKVNENKNEDKKRTGNNITTEFPSILRTQSDKVNTFTDGDGGRSNKRSKKIVNSEDFLDILIQNEPFWQWIGEWTATFSELFMERITNIIKDEVASQVKYYLKHNNITNTYNTKQQNDSVKCSNVKNNLTEAIKVDNTINKNNTGELNKSKDNIINDIIPNNNANVLNNTNMQDINRTNPVNVNVTKEHIEDMNKTSVNYITVHNTNIQSINGTEPDNQDSGSEDLTKKNNTIENNKKDALNNPENNIKHEENGTKPISDKNDNTVKNDSINFHKLGRVILNSNIKDTLYPNNNLENLSNNKTNINASDENPVKVDIETIYGNSIGNDKVTNVYIFRVNNESDINALSALTDFLTTGPHQHVIIADDGKLESSDVTSNIKGGVDNKVNTEVRSNSTDTTTV